MDRGLQKSKEAGACLLIQAVKACGWRGASSVVVKKARMGTPKVHRMEAKQRVGSRYERSLFVVDYWRRCA